VLTRDGRLDALTVRVERRASAAVPAAALAGEALAQRVKNTIG
jgi:phenylacetate-CoA ligase